MTTTRTTTLAAVFAATALIAAVSSLASLHLYLHVTAALVEVAVPWLPVFVIAIVIAAVTDRRVS